LKALLPDRKLAEEQKGALRELARPLFSFPIYLPKVVNLPLPVAAAGSWRDLRGDGGRPFLLPDGLASRRFRYRMCLEYLATAADRRPSLSAATRDIAINVINDLKTTYFIIYGTGEFAKYGKVMLYDDFMKLR
jgi:hypothetical protein